MGGFPALEILKKHKIAITSNVQNGANGVTGVLVQFLVDQELKHQKGNVLHILMHVRDPIQEQRNATHKIVL